MDCMEVSVSFCGKNKKGAFSKKKTPLMDGVSGKDLANPGKINGLQAVSKELYPIKSNNPKHQKILHVRLQYLHRLFAPDHEIIRA